MIVVAPAVVFGALVVFGAGYLVTSAVLNIIADKEKTKKDIDRIAKIVGSIAVMLVVLLMLVAPELAIPIWTALTVLGVLFGLSTFFFNKPTTRVQTRTKYRPPASTRVPPVQEDEYRPPATTGVPPVQGDPYRNLMAKARYDQSLVDRLIKHERERMPYASLDDLCRSIIARLERDNQ